MSFAGSVRRRLVGVVVVLAGLSFGCAGDGVEDGNVITSRKPDDLDAFVGAVLGRLQPRGSATSAVAVRTGSGDAHATAPEWGSASRS